MYEGVPILLKLKSRIHSIIDSCSRCNTSSESVVHCLLQCPMSSQVWRLLSYHPYMNNRTWGSLVDWWVRLLEDIKAESNWKNSLHKIAITCWYIWKARNMKVFEGKDVSSQEIINSTLKLMEIYHFLHNSLVFSLFPIIFLFLLVSSEVGFSLFLFVMLF